MTLLVAVGAAVLAALGYGLGSLLQAIAVRPGSSRPLALRPTYVAGLALDGVAWLLSLAALRALPLFAVQSLLAGSLGVTAVLARVVLGVQLRRADVAALVVLVVALGALGGAAGEQLATAPGRGVTVALLTAAGLLVLAALVAQQAGPLPLAVLAGLGFSGAALAARSTHGTLTQLLHEPVAYSIAAFGVVGAYAYATALERGAVTAVTALLWSVEVVVPAVVGVLALGDQVRTGWWPAAVAGLVAVVAASGVLASRAADPVDVGA